MAANVGTLLVEIGADVARLRRDMGKAHQEVANAAQRMSRAMNTVGVSMAGAFSVATISQAAQAIFKAQVEAERLAKAYSTIEGSAAGARQQLAFLRSESERLGMQYQVTAQAAKTFFAAGKGTALEGEMRNIFSAVSEAGTALSLSQDELNGIFLALGQMISKGKVQAEELRGQLGERLPGAFGLAAKAMGVTTGELDKMLESGTVLAEDLLPKLAEAMHNKFGKAAMDAAKGGAQEVNRMATEWESFKANVMDSGPMIAAIKAVTDALRQSNEELLIRQMEAKGIEGTTTENVYGTRETEYTNAQIKAFKEYGTVVVEEINRIERAKQQAALNDYASGALELAIGKASSTSKEYLKNSDTSKAQKIRQEAQEAIDAQKAAREQDTQNAQRYSDRIVQIERERDKQIAALGKSAATEAKKHAKDIEDANRARLDAIDDIRKLNDETKAQTEAIQGEIDALREVSGLYGTDYADQAALIQAQTRAQQEYRKELEKGVTAENAAAKQAATLAKTQADIDARKQSAAKSLASGFAGGSYEAERTQLTAAYAEAAKYTTDRVALEAELQRKLGNLESARLKKTENGTDGMKAALLDYTESVGTASSRMASLWGQGFKSMEDALSNFVGKGELDIESLFDTLRVEAARSMVVQPLLSGLSSSSLFSGLSGMFSGLFGSHHTGGVVGSGDAGSRNVSPFVFSGAPRFHSGGIVGDEVPIIAKRGEGVFTQEQMEALGQSSSAQKISFTVVNRSGQNVKMSMSKVQQTDEGMTATLLLDMVSRNVGGLRTGLQKSLGK